MLFALPTVQQLLLLTGSLSATVAAPLRFRRAPSGWPHSTSDSRSSFGITGGFQPNFLGTVDGAPALIGTYPAGSYAGSNQPGQPKGPGIAGFIFEAAGAPGVHVDQAQEAILTYDVKFPTGFEWALGGKMPGLYGGDDPATAGECAGGHHSDTCWSARIMWRVDGKGELYAYLPTANQDLAVCKGKCDVKYGASIGTGDWVFQAGQWTTITERVKLNSIGKKDGEIEISINGASALKVNGLQLRSSAQGRIRGAMVHSFFGGSSSPSYASPKDQNAYFRNFNIQVTQAIS